MSNAQDTKGQTNQPIHGQRPRIGVIGGTFDPVHVGHLLAAERCREQLQLQQIRFVPAFVSPFKLDKRSTDGKHRLEMLQLATNGNPAFQVDDRELRRGGTSFTVDTLRELTAELPDHDLVFLMGADSLADFDKWREPREICRLARVVVVARGGEAAPDFSKLAAYTPTSFDASEHLIAMPQCEISSTAIRGTIAAGQSIRYQVPAAVAAYIAQHGLYAG